MKAFVLRSYGSPDRLTLTDVDQPVPAAGEVLVRVRATSVNPYDWHGINGQPYVARLMPGGLGLRGPKPRIPGGDVILGCDVAGDVVAVGAGVASFRAGDEVFGLLRDGGFAEYVSVRADLLARKPANMSYEQAAAVPMAGVTALLAVRDVGRLEKGHRVLVNGATGGVGTFAVQIASALGASATGVCGAHNAALVRSLGAESVIDYRAENFTRRGERYDVVVDIAGGHGALAIRRVLTRHGTLVVVGGPAGRWVQPAGHALSTLAVGSLISARVGLADAVGCAQKRECLTALADLIENGSVTPVIDREYPFAEIPEAVRYQMAGHAPGKVVVTIPAESAAS
jgi:NADPH:quinone reductase-like Zn-dependent oxidoreductase